MKKEELILGLFSMQELSEAICGIDRTTNTEEYDKERVDVDEHIK